MSAQGLSRRRGELVRGAKRERLLADHAAWLERRQATKERDRLALEGWCRQTGRAWGRSNTSS